MLLDWLGARHDDPRMADAARRLEAGVTATVHAGTSTRDIGGSASCSEFTAAVVEQITG
jgi:3-isopropylmalate dehydrogenase